jgi:hypothetical protein
MKVLYVYDSGSNRIYLEKVLRYQTHIFKDFSCNFCHITDYLNVNQDEFDILIYQTFPDENHPFKFHKERVLPGDEKFWKFKGVKILMDSFGWGDRDGFARFGEEGMRLPRVKHLPSYSFLKEANVILACPVYVGDITGGMPDGKRDVSVHCAFHTGIFSHKIRENIIEILHGGFDGAVNFDRIPRSQYLDFLKRTWISVNAPGDGPCSDTFYYAMKCGALTFAEETIDRYQLIPQGTLAEGEHYVSFSLDTLTDKLKYLLDNPDKCDRIRRSGYEKLKEGYDLEKTAKDFHQVLENLYGEN